MSWGIPRTIGTFIFYLLSFLLTWAHANRTIKDWRASFVLAFLYFSFYAWILTEVLSFFKVLTSIGILFGWMGYNITLLLLFIFLYRKGYIQIPAPHITPFKWEYGVLCAILFLTFFIAIVYPPNNWDSMTYHLPRIEHWLQNRSLAHYFTTIDRQTKSAPLAEILILQGRALSGDDILTNLVQWFAFLGAIIGVSRITKHLGMNKTLQIGSAVFFATVPMAILQASSTQTDLVETFFIISLTECFLAWYKTGTFRQSIDFGMALGMAILTKGTAYPFAFPFVLSFAIISFKNFRKRFLYAFFAALLCLFVNIPHYTRNYAAFGEPLGIHNGTVSDFSIKSFLLTSIANVNSNIAVPLPSSTREKLNNMLQHFLSVLNASSRTFPYGLPKIVGPEYLFAFHEDIARNFLHTILIIIAIFLLLCNKKKKKKYLFAIIGSWCMFTFFIPWQPWITRLQLPFFALSAPVFALVFEDEKLNKYKTPLLLLLVCFSSLPLLLNYPRPLLPIARATCSRAIWNTSRDEIVFNNRHNLYKRYNSAYQAIVQTEPNNIGIMIGGDSWEYPLWRYVRKNMPGEKISITHVQRDAINPTIDVLFILDSDDAPRVLVRAPENESEWRTVFAD